MQASIAHVAGHEDVGGKGAAVGGDHGRWIPGDADERDQRALADLLPALLDCRNFFVGQAVGRTLTGEVTGHRGHVARAPLMHARDVGAAQLAHPIRVAAERVEAQAADALDVRLVEYVQVGTQEQVDAHCIQFATDDGPDLPGQFGIPRGPHGQRRGQGGKATAQRRPRQIVADLFETDEQRHVAGRHRTDGRQEWVVARRPWRHRHRIQGLVFGDEQAVGNGLKLIRQARHFPCRVDAAAVGEVLVARAQDGAAHPIAMDQRDDVAVERNIVAGEGDDEELADAVCRRHAGKNVFHRRDQ